MNYCPPGPPEERFLAKVDKCGPLTPKLGGTRCWQWTGGSRKTGYGSFKLKFSGGVEWSAHRASWILFRGSIPDGLYVLHRCDNPLCVNPDHLFTGTQLDNVHDMLAKNRSNYTGPRNPHTGEQHHQSVLTESNVIEIRSLSDSGVSQRRIAQMFLVSQYTIWAIINRKKWRHIP